MRFVKVYALFVFFCTLSSLANPTPSLSVATAEFQKFKQSVLELSTFADAEGSARILAFLARLEKNGELTDEMFLAIGGFLQDYFTVRLWDVDLGDEYQRAYQNFEVQVGTLETMLNCARGATEEVIGALPKLMDNEMNEWVDKKIQECGQDETADKIVLQLTKEWLKYKAKAQEIMRLVEKAKEEERKKQSSAAAAAAIIPPLRLQQTTESPLSPSSPTSPTSPAHKKNRFAPRSPTIRALTRLFPQRSSAAAAAAAASAAIPHGS